MTDNAGFCTVINCMDGRTQQPVIDYMKKHFRVLYVDSITEPGPVKILADRTDPILLQSILNRVKISIEKHKSVGLALIAHDDCAGNPATPDQQKRQLSSAADWLKTHFFGLPILALWVDHQWQVQRWE